MAKAHPTDAAIVATLVSEETETADTRRNRRHIERCAECGKKRDEARLFLPEGWESDRDVVGRAVELLGRLREERAGLDDLMEQSLKGHTAFWRSRLEQLGDVHTLAVVEGLIRRTEMTYGASPGEAFEMSLLAVEIAEEIRIDSYAFDAVILVRGQAWREHAFLLYYVGRLPEALAAVERADDLLRQLRYAHNELGRAQLVRAAILKETERPNGALAIAVAAADTFRRHGDRRLWAKARIFVIAILIEEKRLGEALAAWREVEDDGEVKQGSDYRFMLQEIGACYRMLRDYEQASHYLRLAIAEHRKHNAHVEVARTEWSLAVTLVESGRAGEAIPTLRGIWREFADRGVEIDAALVALELAEALLLTNQPDEVPHICRTLLDRFTRNSMTSRAITALSYLREAVAMQRASVALVRDVHDFIRDAAKNPTRTYVPPKSL
jgi:tetratricopeptide (TPR) repeat protein